MATTITPIPYSQQNLANCEGGVPALQPIANLSQLAGIRSRHVDSRFLQMAEFILTPTDLGANLTTGITLLNTPPTIYSQFIANNAGNITGSSANITGYSATPTIQLVQAYARLLYTGGNTQFTDGSNITLAYTSTIGNGNVTNLAVIPPAAVTGTSNVTYDVPKKATTSTAITLGAGSGISAIAPLAFGNGTSSLLIEIWYNLNY